VEAPLEEPLESANQPEQPPNETDPPNPPDFQQQPNLIPDQDHALNEIKRENLMRRNLQREQEGGAAAGAGVGGGDHQFLNDPMDYIDDNYLPHTEYTTVCNGDFAPIVCNDFICEFLDKDHGACSLDKSDAIDLTRNFCDWMSRSGLTCAVIKLNIPAQ